MVTLWKRRPVVVDPVTAPRAAQEPLPDGDPCPNCGDCTSGNFCRNCGQARRVVHVSMGEMVADFMDDQLALNSRLPVTLAFLLVRPGFLTREYLKGRIASYIRPLRLYVGTSVLFFVLFAWLASREQWINVGPGGGRPANRADSARLREARRQLSQMERGGVLPPGILPPGVAPAPAPPRADSAAPAPAPIASPAAGDSAAASPADSVAKTTGGDAGDSVAAAASPPDSASPPAADASPPAAGIAAGVGMATEQKDSTASPPSSADATRRESRTGAEGARETRRTETGRERSGGESIASRRPGEEGLQVGDPDPEDLDSLAFSGMGAFSDTLNARYRKFKRMDRREMQRTLVDAAQEQLPRMMFAMLPIFALLLKLLYARRGRYYVEHFIFSLHFHAFVFLLLTVYMGLEYVPGVAGSGLGAGVTIWMLLYLFIAMKSVYGQGVVKTALKYFTLLWAYFFTLLTGFMVTVMLWVYTL